MFCFVDMSTNNRSGTGWSPSIVHSWNQRPKGRRIHKSINTQVGKYINPARQGLANVITVINCYSGPEMPLETVNQVEMLCVLHL